MILHIKLIVIERRNHRQLHYTLNQNSLEKSFAYKIFCIPESLNKNISHHPFDYKITIVNSQHENTNPKCDFALKTSFNVRFKDFWYTKLFLSQKHILFSY